MRIRDVLEELEVSLGPVPTASPAVSQAHGKGEWKVYGDGARQCEVSVSGVNLPDETLLHLVVSSQPIGVMQVRRRMARYGQESARGDSVPAVQPDQVLQVMLAGQVILEGAFYLE